MPSPPWFKTFSTGNEASNYIILTKRKIKVEGAGRNVVVSDRTLDFIMALTLVAQAEKM
jgi:hypothetical protein